MNVLAAALAFVVSALSLFVIRPLLRRLDTFDVPNERSSHVVPTLRGGGLGPLTGSVAGFLVIYIGAWHQVLSASPIMIAAITLGGLGFVEDSIGLPVRIRAFLQLAIGAVVSAALVVSTGASPWWIAGGAVIVAAYVNVTNFMDGINGISGLHGLVVGAGYALLGLILGSSAFVATSVVLAAAFAAFLPWNLGRGRVFLGDTGSYLLGGAVSAIAIWALLLAAPVFAVMGPVAIYLADTGFTLAKRVVRGDRWYEAHRSHTYQRLVDAGLSHLAVACIVMGFTVIATGCSFLSVLGWGGTGAAVLGVVATVLTYLLLPRMVFGRGAPLTMPAELDKGAAVRTVAPRNHFDESVRALPWAVVGASGFIGESVCEFLREAGAQPVELSAPRVSMVVDASRTEVVLRARELAAGNHYLVEALRGCAVVVNAAGVAAPDSAATPELFGANALLPVLLAELASQASVPRLIHLSSAAVQGGRAALDESTDVEPFSPYSASKALGELALADWRGTLETVSEVVILRAASVQGRGRKTTESLRRIAKLPIASVAAPGSQPSPVVSVRSLASFIAQVGIHGERVPGIVLQPWEGMTTRSVLRAAGGKDPIVLPAWICRVVVRVGYGVTGLLGGRMRGAVRRVELMWFGQGQRSDWAEAAGVSMPCLVSDVLRADTGVLSRSQTEASCTVRREGGRS